VQNQRATAALADVFPAIARLNDVTLAAMGEASLRDMVNSPYLSVTPAQLDAIDRALSALSYP
jgi:hypothetical protein